MKQDIPRSDSERLASIEVTLYYLKTELLGNGQPGRLHEHEKRIERLENWKWWVIGIATALGIALGAGGQHIIEAAIK